MTYLNVSVLTVLVAQWYRIHLQCRRPGFDPWVGKIPWRKKWQPTPVFLPGESHGQRNLVGYSPWGRKELDMTWMTESTLSQWNFRWSGQRRLSVEVLCNVRIYGKYYDQLHKEHGKNHWKQWEQQHTDHLTELRLACLGRRRKAWRLNHSGSFKRSRRWEWRSRWKQDHAWP